MILAPLVLRILQSMTVHQIVRGVALITSVLAPAMAHAQPATNNPADLGYWLEAGDRVVVVGSLADGADVRTIKGTFKEVSDRLVVVHDKHRYEFPLDGIARIERPKDRIWNGALIGYAIGLAPFALMELDCHRSEGCWEGFAFAAGLVIAGPIGFGIGALTDAMISRPRLVYLKVAPQAATVRPFITKGGGGVRLSVAF